MRTTCHLLFITSISILFVFVFISDICLFSIIVFLAENFVQFNLIFRLISISNFHPNNPNGFNLLNTFSERDYQICFDNRFFDRLSSCIDSTQL